MKNPPGHRPTPLTGVADPDGVDLDPSFKKNRDPDPNLFRPHKSFFSSDIKVNIIDIFSG